MGSRIWFLLFCCLLGTQIIFSQSTTGNIEGWVFDENNQPIVGVNLLFTSPDLQGIKGTTTDDRGFFYFSALPVGNYVVKISHLSYQNIILNDIHLYLGQTTSIGEIHLKTSNIETEEVIISGGKPLIDTRSAANSKSLTNSQFIPLPLERNYFHLAELLPSANISYKNDGGTNFAGATGAENRYFIDGAEITHPGYGTLLYNLPYNFIRQVEVQTGGYQAEYKSSLGGIINTITYSGGNEFHGSVFGFFTNNNFSNSPKLKAESAPLGNYSDYDFGFGFGGPIVKDKLWYYLAYDPNMKSEDVYVNGLGMLNEANTYHRFAGKLTWSPNVTNIFTLALSGNMRTANVISNTNPSYTVMNPEYVNTDVKDLSINTTLKGIHHLSQNFFLESIISLGITRYQRIPLSYEISYGDNVNRTLEGGSGYLHDVKSKQNLLSFSVKGTLSLLTHIIKAGVEFSSNLFGGNVDWKSLGRYSFGYEYWFSGANSSVKSNNLSLFIQDTWQISPRFCFNAGIRYDPQWIIGSDGSIAQKITDQVQPRLGLIYQPGELGTQKITASFGRFYEPVLLSLSASYHDKSAYWGFTDYPNDPRVDTSGAISSPNLTSYVTNISDLEGQYYDEFTLGYEKQLTREFKIGIRGIYRNLGQGIEDGVPSPEDQQKYGSLQVYGNPGSGVLSMLPKMKREYTALELTFERFASSGFNFLISYVLSRNRGNYDGFAETYDVTGGASIIPNNSNQFALSRRLVNGYGLLPNDRTHVFKVFSSYHFNFGLTAGMAFQWMSGTPLNELGVDSVYYYASTFLVTRGTAGRSPSIWDLSFRFAYDISKMIRFGNSAKIILDVLHFASQKRALDFDQYHYYDYAQNYPNVNYMQPIQFQPPMSFRVGMEVNF